MLSINKAFSARDDKSITIDKYGIIFQMSEIDPSLRRVSFELESADIPELLSIVASFVAAHNLRIEFDDASVTEIVKPTESAQYSPKRVEWFPNPDGDIAVVTPGLLNRFEHEQNELNSGKSNSKYRTATRIHTSTLRNIGSHSWIPSANSQLARPYVYTDSSDRFIGLLASSLPKFADKLVHEPEFVHGLGPRAGEFLAEYCKHLFIES